MLEYYNFPFVSNIRKLAELHPYISESKVRKIPVYRLSSDRTLKEKEIESALVLVDTRPTHLQHIWLITLLYVQDYLNYISIIVKLFKNAKVQRSHKSKSIPIL